MGKYQSKEFFRRVKVVFVAVLCCVLPALDFGKMLYQRRHLLPEKSHSGASLNFSNVCDVHV
ncbi:CLUMA_CG019390, isoform A [Clunio marinus]|uniref:CLUMA_CG019390, isoform A n=1 Tax=Clunio marinus TaxID=568069 RepID=A0A1J1J153_9DIPT|nr:CLUMA_CG019390, isoform A [Clunio marinus]